MIISGRNEENALEKVVDPKTGVKKAFTSQGEWFDTFEFGSKNGIATQSGDEDDTFAADAPLADAAFGK